MERFCHRLWDLGTETKAMNFLPLDTKAEESSDPHLVSDKLTPPSSTTPNDPGSCRKEEEISCLDIGPC